MNEGINAVNQHMKGALFAILGGASWGLSGSVGQYLFDVEGMDSRWLVPIRLGLAGIVLLVYCLLKYGRERVIEPWLDQADRRELLLYGLAGISGCQFFYFTTIMLSTAGVGTILQDLSPIAILLFVCIKGKRYPTVREVFCIALALFGIFLITTHGDFRHMAVPASALLTGVICAFCVMIYNVAPKRFLEKYPASLLQGWSFCMGGALFSVIFHIWTWNYHPTLWGYAGIAFVVLIGNVAAFNLYQTGVRLIGPSKAILYGFAEPITAAVIGALLLGSRFTLWDAVGFAAVFLMMALL